MPLCPFRHKNTHKDVSTHVCWLKFIISTRQKHAHVWAMNWLQNYILEGFWGLVIQKANNHWLAKCWEEQYDPLVSSILCCFSSSNLDFFALILRNMVIVCTESFSCVHVSVCAILPNLLQLCQYGAFVNTEMEQNFHFKHQGCCEWEHSITSNFYFQFIFQTNVKNVPFIKHGLIQ